MDHELVEVLIDKVDVNKKDEKGKTAIQVVSNEKFNKRSVKIITLLLSKGADTDACNNYGESLLFLAKQHNFEELKNILESKNAIELRGVNKKI